jgi:hypothetical protein
VRGNGANRGVGEGACDGMITYGTYGGHGPFSPTLAMVIGLVFLAYPLIAWWITKRRWADDMATILAFVFGAGFIISAVVYWTTH